MTRVGPGTISLAFLPLLFTPVAEQDRPVPRGPAPEPIVPAERVRGTVVKVDAVTKAMMVRTRGGEERCFTYDGSTVMRTAQGGTGDIADIQPGAKVLVSLSARGGEPLVTEFRLQ